MDGYSILGTNSGLARNMSEHSAGSVVQLIEEDLNLDVDASNGVRSHELPEVHRLLSQYNGIFASRVVFPPPQPYNHIIPLIDGARPVCIRPYRYAPVLKDEIERQVNEMLEVELIQHSASPFLSPVLLVKKKDNT
jgi:hypothetical protein